MVFWSYFVPVPTVPWPSLLTPLLSQVQTEYAQFQASLAAMPTVVTPATATALAGLQPSKWHRAPVARVTR